MESSRDQIAPEERSIRPLRPEAHRRSLAQVQPIVELVIRDTRLRQALTLHLTGQFALAVEGDGAGAGQAGVILTTTSDMNPERCAEVVENGNAVVILAAVLREHEQAQYLAAGASQYLAMTLEPGELEAALQHASGLR